MKTQQTRYQWPRVELDAPITSGPLTVFPIQNGGEAPRDYILLSDAVEKGIAKVTETSEKGDVPVIVIENLGPEPILGVQGEEYVGAKQNRTLNVTVLVGPGKTKIPVTCVEQGRWDRGAAMFGVGEYEGLGLRLMKTEMSNISSRTLKEKLKKFAADQFKVWGHVEQESARHGVRSATGAMHAFYESKHVRAPLTGIADGIKLPEGARGAVIAMGGSTVAADLFESSWIFQRIWPRLLRSYALSALYAKGTPPSVEAAETFVSKPVSLPCNATPSVDLGEDVRWEDKSFLVAALVWRDRFLHSLIFARDPV